MDEMIDTSWPYKYCESCRKLSPIEPLTGDINRCMICNEIITSEVGGRTVYLSISEARVRNLHVV